ncbi:MULTISPECIES: hypothetical protein [unclassified Brevundimonas]|uniref:hypothetical protein n=1 Tax=unclassified Brevundimonas TaxID=2622653 RepID=UPI0025B838C9|nr:MULTISPECIES: hypothetical protein [unclassified Brevundimonas]
MVSTLLIVVGTGAALSAVWLLFIRWQDTRRHRLLVAAAWGLVALSIVCWSTFSNPDVGTAFATLVVMFGGMAVVLKGKPTAGLLPFPETRKAVPDTKKRTGRSGTAARALAAILVAPVAGLSAGLLVWSLSGGHDATRFVTAVFVFLVGYALFQIWSLGAERAWRALGMMSALCGVFIALAYWRL